MSSNTCPETPPKEEVEIELSEEAHEALVFLSETRGVSMDQVIEDILKDFIATHRANTSKEQS
jgi:hypothetical protein